MKRPIALAIALLATVALPLAACSSDGSDGSAAPDAAATDSPAPGEASAAIAFEEGRTVIDVDRRGAILGAERIGLAGRLRRPDRRARRRRRLRRLLPGGNRSAHDAQMLTSASMCSTAAPWTTWWPPGGTRASS
ncbi:MAG: hypothetical protein R2702_03300 [Acidimicrobiales bacterium]